MKSMFVLIFILPLLLTNCSQKVQRRNVQKSSFGTISSVVKKTCEGRCEAIDCWPGTEDVTVCRVMFNYTDDDQKKTLLLAASENLWKNGSLVGFCGGDSSGSIMVAAIVSDISAGMKTLSEQALEKACSTKPMEH